MEYTIKNEYLTLVVSSLGAEKQSLISNKNVSYLRKRDDYWNRIAPHLFPIVGKLRDLKTIINEKEYNMPQHGLIRDMEFSLVEKKENMITLNCQYNEETLEKYPFKFSVYVTYQLDGKSLITKFCVRNIDNKEIAFNYGGHPGFRCPLYDNEQFNDYKIVFSEEENFDAPTVVATNGTLNFDNTIPYTNIHEIELDYKYFTIDAIVIPNIKSKSVKLINKDQKGIKFDFPSFPTLAIWTKPNAPFVCLEPWIGNADHHNCDYDFYKKDNLQFLDVEEEFQATYTISILD